MIQLWKEAEARRKTLEAGYSSITRSTTLAERCVQPNFKSALQTIVQRDRSRHTDQGAQQDEANSCKQHESVQHQ